MSKEARMVSIKMNTVSAGPEGTRHKGKVYEVPEVEATALIQGGFAEYETVMIAVPKSQNPKDKNAAADAIKKLKDEEAAAEAEALAAAEAIKDPKVKIEKPANWKK